MPAYETNNLLATSPAQSNVGTGFKTMLELYTVTGTLRRGAIFEVGVSADGLPANNSLSWDISYMTAIGTGGVAGAGNTPLDGADSAALCLSRMNETGEPTYTANSSRWARAINQQVTFLWNAQGSAARLIFAAVNLNGLGCRVKAAAYTGTVIVNYKYEE